MKQVPGDEHIIDTPLVSILKATKCICLALVCRELLLANGRGRVDKAFDKIIVINVDLRLISNPLVVSPLFPLEAIGPGSCATLAQVDESLGCVGMLEALPAYMICVCHLFSCKFLFLCFCSIFLT